MNRSQATRVLASLPRSPSARAALVLVAGSAALGCSTIPGMPTSGGGAKLNLATVAYVEERQDEVVERVTQNITSELPRILDEQLADDRERLSALETALIAQQGQLGELFSSLDEVEAEVSVLPGMRDRVGELAASNGELRSMTRSLSAEMDSLPSDTLREFNRALGAHLDALEEVRDVPSAEPVAQTTSEFRDGEGDVAAPPPDLP